jgi:hypothetical protein
MGQLDTPNRSYQGGITTRDFWRQRAWGLLKMGNPKSQHGVTFFRRFGKVNQDIPQCSVESLAATVTEPTEQTRTWSLGWSWRNSARNIAQNAIFTQVSTTRNIWFLYIPANVDIIYTKKKEKHNPHRKLRRAKPYVTNKIQGSIRWSSNKVTLWAAELCNMPSHSHVISRGSWLYISRKSSTYSMSYKQCDTRLLGFST